MRSEPECSSGLAGMAISSRSIAVQQPGACGTDTYASADAPTASRGVDELFVDRACGPGRCRPSLGRSRRCTWPSSVGDLSQASSAIPIANIRGAIFSGFGLEFR